MKKIYCVRHAITDEHVNARINPVMGFKDIGLNEEGIKEANKLGGKLKRTKIEGILCSNLKSSVETAQIINQYLAVPLYISDLYRERDQGEYKAKELKEIYERNPQFSITTKGKGREDLRSFMNRTKIAFHNIENDFNWSTCLLVSHKGFLQTMTATCIGIKPSNWYLCEIRAFIYSDGKWIQSNIEC